MRLGIAAIPPYKRVSRRTRSIASLHFRLNRLFEMYCPLRSPWFLVFFTLGEVKIRLTKQVGNAGKQANTTLNGAGYRAQSH
jgi:hypothetical protein